MSDITHHSLWMGDLVLSVNKRYYLTSDLFSKPIELQDLRVSDKSNYGKTFCV